MLIQSVDSYLAVRHACGFKLKSESNFYENSPSSQTQEANITFALKPPSSGPDWHDRFINAPTGLVK